MPKKRGKKTVAVETFDSDDERAYSKEPQPDKDDDEYFHDEVDQFHNNRDKIMLDKGAPVNKDTPSSDEEEVLGFDDDSDDDDEQIAKYEEQLRKVRGRGFKDELASDIEDEEDGLPDEKAWGQKKTMYYGDDMDDYDEIDSAGSETEAALLEEKEALAMQKRMAEQLEEEDFGLDIVKTVKKPKDAPFTEEKEVITKDLSKLSKREKLQILKKESPELLDLIEDYKTKMSELKERWLPIFRLIQAGKVPDSKGVQYIQAKVQLYLNYCTNVSFYVMLKAKHTPVEHHPVITRLLQYRNLIKELSAADDIVKKEVDELLQKIKSGEEIQAQASPCEKPASSSKAIYLKRRKMLKGTSAADKADKKKLSQLMDEEEQEEMDGPVSEGGRAWGRKRKLEEGPYETADEVAALEYYNMMKAGKKQKPGQEEADEGEYEPEGEKQVEGGYGYEEEEEEGGKRAITYQIEKNKGLTPSRRKDKKNPRVKHRLKYRKAIIRRRGQVREVRKELTPYAGEISGIRAGIKKSIKLK